MEIQVLSCSIRNEDSVEIFGSHININLKFDYHVNQLCKKESKKLHALARIAKYMDINKQRMLMKTFVSSQFSYCPLIWMFHSRKVEHRIDSIHKRTLKLAYQDSHDLSFQELLTKDKSVSIRDSKSLSSLAPKWWDLLPNSIKKFCFSQGIQNKN